MNSGYPGEFIYGGGNGSGSGGNGLVGGSQNGVPSEFRQQFQQRTQNQQEMILRNQIAQRRMDLSIGKRSFGDYQSYHQQLQQQQQFHQQQQRRVSYLRSLQQQLSRPMMSQNQYLMRSFKQRTNNNNNGFSIDLANNINANNNSSTRVGVPVHKLNNNPTPQLNPSNNPSHNPVRSSDPNSVEDQKQLTLEEIEKHLLNDDDYGIAIDIDSDAVSGISNSDWNVDIFQDLLKPSPIPSPSPNPGQLSNNVISPSPTSSTSSCCTGSPSTTATALSAKQLIAETAVAISEGNNDVVSTSLSKLGQFADYKGNSGQRLAYHMHHALRSRACPSEFTPPIGELFGRTQISSVYTLYDVSPCFKFALLAANLVMLEAITSSVQVGLKQVHVIDFDVGHGAQYVNLLRALGERKLHAPCPVVKITVVETELCDQGGVPDSVKDGLVELAERVGIELKYSCLTRRISELSGESIGCEDGESVVVNFAFKVYRVPDESVSVENLRDELLRRVRGLSPRAVTLVEYDMNGNNSPFMIRVNEASGYYGALFDSLEATLPRENQDRCRVEDWLGRKIVNLIACEGKDRVERAEVFGKWRARMGMAGFQLKPINQSVVESMRAKLDSARGGNPGFTVKEENGGVGFGWMGRGLTTASSWR